jgi:methylisocitrate lyase
MSTGKAFRQAVADNNPLQVVGAVDAYSAIMAEKVGHKALYLSGGGVPAC